MGTKKPRLWFFQAHSNWIRTKGCIYVNAYAPSNHGQCRASCPCLDCSVARLFATGPSNQVMEMSGAVLYSNDGGLGSHPFRVTRIDHISSGFSCKKKTKTKNESLAISPIYGDVLLSSFLSLCAGVSAEFSRRVSATNTGVSTPSLNLRPKLRAQATTPPKRLSHMHSQLMRIFGLPKGGGDPYDG